MPAFQAPKTKPSSPRIPASVKNLGPTPAALRNAASKMLSLKIRENEIKALRKEPTEILVANCQGETFTFPEGKVRVSKDCPEALTDVYTIEFNQDAWDSLQNDKKKAALQEQLIKLGVVTLTRKVKAAAPARVSVILADVEEK